jgi:hypothetical protein
MVPNVTNTLMDSLNRGLLTTAAFLPNLLSGTVILLIGILIASAVKRIILEIFKALKMEAYLKRYGIPEAKNEFSWTNVLSEIARWFVVILFLIPTAEIWGLPQVATILNTFLLYIPNVFVAAIIGLVGLVFARLASDVTLASTRELASEVSKTIASVVRIAITVFVLLAVLNQLGVAQDLIHILFTGVVAMIAIAGGIAFGLGGKDLAKSLLEGLRKKLK